MGRLSGLDEYLAEGYHLSVFDEAQSSGRTLEMHIHKQRVVQAKVLKDLKYDVELDVEGAGKELLPKVQVKLVYPAETAESVRPLIKVDQKVRRLELEPILAPGRRRHVKNKSLYPLMKEREVVFFTLLEGEVIKGLISAFSRYEVTVSLKGGLPATILRHSIYELRNKKGRSFLKSFQETHRDWEKSPLFTP